MTQSFIELKDFTMTHKKHIAIAAGIIFCVGYVFRMIVKHFMSGKKKR